MKSSNSQLGGRSLMASQEIDAHVSQICENILLRPSVVRECRKILNKVKIPEGWEETYQLQEEHLSYKYRLKLFKDFIIQRKGRLIVSQTDLDEFSTALRNFLSDEENQRSDDDQLELSSERLYIDLFEKNWKIEGVVVGKTASRACVLVKSARSRRLEEMVLPYNAGAFPGLGLNLKVGDILCVTKNRREEGKHLLLDPEVVRHILLEKYEIDSFLSKLCEIRLADSVSSMLIEINQRCFAAWKYILQQEKCPHSVTEQILTVCDHVCSSTSKTPEKMMEQFAKSNFLSKVLPDFVDQIEFHIGDNSSGIHRLLQNFLFHVLLVNPSCGHRVVSLARCISAKMIAGATDSPQEIGRSTCEFLCKLSSILALKVPGAFSDLESLEWQQLPLIPTAEEIHHKIKKDDLPAMREKYDSEEEYLETNFRLIREECFHKLKKGISDFTQGNSPDPRDMMLYRVTIWGISTRREYSPAGLSMCLNYKEVFGQEQSQTIDLESTGWMKYGNLLCISLDGTFEHPIWVQVERKSISHEKVVWVTCCTDRNEINDAEVITKLQELGDEGQEAFMAESSTFFTAFGPAMHVLQQKETVPFKEYIVYGTPSTEPPSYISEIKSPPDWSILYEPSSCSKGKASSSKYSLLKDFEARKNLGLKEKLDDTQMAAIELALHHKVALIQGPPGTGKSYVGVSLVQLLLSMKVPHEFGPILVVTYKNHALDHFLKDCVAKIAPEELKLVRVGSQGHQDLTEYNLGKIAGSGTWSSYLYKLNKAMMSQLFGMQDQVRDCYDKLRKIEVFGVDTITEEATDAHIKSLLTDGPDEREFANSEELEQLLKDREKNPQLLSRKQLDVIKTSLKAWLPDINSFSLIANDQSSRLAASSCEDRRQSASKIRKSRTIGGANDEDSINNMDRLAEERERMLAMDGTECESDTDSDCCMPAQREIKPWERHVPRLSDGKIAPFRNLMNAVNVYDLKNDEKISLVCVMQNQYRRRVIKEFECIAKLYTQKYQEFQELKNQHHVEVLSKRHVIGMTVTGAALRADLLANIKPSVMIVEEAAEILEPQLVAVIPPSVQHLIMIGDHKQLRPTVIFNRLARHHKLDVSMFERLVTSHSPQRSLGHQCRMRDELAELLRVLHIYDKYETRGEMVRNNKPPDCVQNGLCFIEHTSPESDAQGSYSKRNQHEAREIRDALLHLCSNGVAVAKITVLCSYRGQVREIKHLIEKYASIHDVEVTTIDSFQGKENDIILVSLVRSNKKFTIGFLSSMNRLCVAISRARCALYLFGNSAMFSKSSKKWWKKLIEHMRTIQRVSKKFPYPCDQLDEQRTPTRRGYPEESARQRENKGSFSTPIIIIGDNATVNCGIGDVEQTTQKMECGSLDTTARSEEETAQGNEMVLKKPVQESEAGAIADQKPVQDSEELTKLPASVTTADEDKKLQSAEDLSDDVPDKGSREEETAQCNERVVPKPVQECEAGAIADQKPVQNSEDVTKLPTSVTTADEDKSLQSAEDLSGDVADKGSREEETAQGNERVVQEPVQESEAGAISDQKPVQNSEDVTKLPTSVTTADEDKKLQSAEDLSVDVPDKGSRDEETAQGNERVEQEPVQESEVGAISDQKPVQNSEDVTKLPTSVTTADEDKKLQSAEDLSGDVPDKGSREEETAQGNERVVQEPVQESEAGAISDQKPVQNSEDVTKLPTTVTTADEDKKLQSAEDLSGDVPDKGSREEETAQGNERVVQEPVQESETGAISDQKPVQNSEDVTKLPTCVTTADEDKKLQSAKDLSGDVPDKGSREEETAQGNERVVQEPVQESETGAISDQKSVQNSEDVTKLPTCVTTADEDKKLQSAKDLSGDVPGQTCAPQDCFEIALD